MLSLVIVMSTLSANPSGYAERVLYELYQRDIELSKSPNPDYHPERHVTVMTPSKAKSLYESKPPAAVHYDRPIQVWDQTPWLCPTTRSGYWLQSPYSQRRLSR